MNLKQHISLNNLKKLLFVFCIYFDAMSRMNFSNFFSSHSAQLNFFISIVILILSLFEKVGRLELLVYLLIISFVGVSSSVLGSGGNALFLPTLVIIIFSFRKNNPIEIMKLFRISIWSLLILNTVLIRFGYLKNPVDQFGNVLFSLGFNNANSLGMYAFVLFIILFSFWAYKRDKKEKVNYLFNFFELAIIVGLLLASGSRTSEISAVLALIVFLVRLNQFRRLLGYAVFIFSTAFSIFTGIFTNYSHGIMSTLNLLSSGRFYLNNWYLSTYGVKPFGQNILQFTDTQYYFNQYLFLDNAYLYLLIKFGLILFIIFIVFYLCLLKKISDNKFTYLYISVIPLFLMGVFEQTFVDIFVNYSLFFLGSLLGNLGRFSAAKTGGEEL